MFIKPNKTKAKLRAGQPAFGVIATSDDPQLAELFGIAGFDYYMLDAEHGLMDPVQALLQSNTLMPPACDPCM